jgi:hypothetical protein
MKMSVAIVLGLSFLSTMALADELSCELIEPSGNFTAQTSESHEITRFPGDRDEATVFIARVELASLDHAPLKITVSIASAGGYGNEIYINAWPNENEIYDIAYNKEIAYGVEQTYTWNDEKIVCTVILK